MAIKHGAPQIPEKIRVLIKFESKAGFFQTTAKEKSEDVLPQLKEVLDGWKELDAELLATIDRDLLTAGEAGAEGWHGCFIYRVKDLQTIVNMTHSFRATGLDKYFRLEAIIGRPFFLLEQE